MPEYSERVIPEIKLKWYVEDILIEAGERNYIASGEEVVFGNTINYGVMRVDGKLIVGSLINDGIIKVVGTVEIEPLFT